MEQFCFIYSLQFSYFPTMTTPSKRQIKKRVGREGWGSHESLQLDNPSRWGFRPFPRLGESARTEGWVRGRVVFLFPTAVGQGLIIGVLLKWFNFVSWMYWQVCRPIIHFIEKPRPFPPPQRQMRSKPPEPGEITKKRARSKNDFVWEVRRELNRYMEHSMVTGPTLAFNRIYSYNRLHRNSWWAPVRRDPDSGERRALDHPITELF